MNEIQKVKMFYVDQIKRFLNLIHIKYYYLSPIGGFKIKRFFNEYKI